MPVLCTIIRTKRDGTSEPVYFGPANDSTRDIMRDFPEGTRKNALFQLTMPDYEKHAPRPEPVPASEPVASSEPSALTPDPCPLTPDPSSSDDLPDFPSPASPARLGKPAKK